MTRKEELQSAFNCFELMKEEYIWYKQGEKYYLPEYYAIEVALELLKHELEDTVIKEIPKDYKYDTETNDFLVYRHKYNGDEIHIEKPIPLYKLEKEFCEKQAVLDIVEREQFKGDALSEIEKLSSARAKDRRAVLTPKEATNGDMIKAMFPIMQTRDDGNFISFTLDGVVGVAVGKDWWDAPYKSEVEK